MGSRTEYEYFRKWFEVEIKKYNKYKGNSF